MVSLHYICSDCSEEAVVVLVVVITLLCWKILHISVLLAYFCFSFGKYDM
jgi:hypothetical protein